MPYRYDPELDWGDLSRTIIYDNCVLMVYSRHYNLAFDMTTCTDKNLLIMNSRHESSTVRFIVKDRLTKLSESENKNAL
jgi:hypothetical protein